MKNLHRFLIWSMLLLFAAFFLLPLYVMLVTSLKDMADIRNGSLLSLPGGVSRVTVVPLNDHVGEAAGVLVMLAGV